MQFHPEASAAIVAAWAGRDPGQDEGSRAALAQANERFDGPAIARAFAMFDAWHTRATVA